MKNPRTRALRYAMEKITQLRVLRIAPQHGHVLNREIDVALLLSELADLENVGIDAN